MSFSTKTALLALSVAGASSLFCCCVNGDYDLTKNFDKSINIEGDISAPLGNSELIKISDLLSISSDKMGILLVAPNGDYSLSFAGNTSETTFSIPEISITKDLVNEGGLQANIDRDLFLGKMGIISSDTPIPSGLTATQHIGASTTPISIDESVSEEIIDIKNVAGKALGAITFQTNIRKATVTGLSIDFPDYLSINISSDDTDLCYSFDKEKNVLSFEPVEISRIQSIVNLEITDIDFDKIPAGQGFLADEQKIYVNDGIDISSADVTILSDDLGTSYSAIPENIEIDLNLSIGSVDIYNATVKVNPTIDIEPVSVDVGDYPSFISKGTVLDLYDPHITLTVGNDSPIAFSLNADVNSYSNGEETSVHIGSKEHATEEIHINADDETSIYLSRTGNGVPDGYTGIKVANLSEIVKNVPEQMGIANIDAEATDEFVTLQTGKDYTFECTYSVAAPLAFGKDLQLAYSTDFSGWGEIFEYEDSGLSVENAVINFNLVNTIPLGINIFVSAINKDGAPISTITVTSEGISSAGTIDNPSRTPMKLTFKGTAEDMSKMDGIRMSFSATGADNDAEGICLNENQGLKLEDMKLRMQGVYYTNL